MVHTDHGRVLPDKRTARWESKMSSYLFDAYVGVSEELTNYLEERIGVARPKLKTIINGVDTARFLPRTKAERLFIRRQCGLNADDVVIGSVCRFDPIKNLSYLIARMPAILERIPKAKLLLVGEGSCQADLERQIRSFGLTDNVILMPRRNDVENVMPVMDLYANTSISEGTSMTILEAMACGVPVIASAVGGNNSLVSGSHGVLFPLENAALFVDNVVSLLRDISVLEDMGRAARNRAECSYGLSRMVEAYQSCYDAPQDPVSSAGDATRRGSQSDEPQRTLHNNIESATR
jgi:glycosyltransferase involved in cell wall biosynthesis